MADDRPLSGMERYGMAIPVALALGVGYRLLGVPVRPPIDPWITDVDRAIPYVPETVWLYLPGYALCLLLAAWTLDTTRKLRAAAISFAATLALAAPVFVLFPVACARPPASHISGLTGALLRFIETIDTTYNTFPSLHIAMATLAAWIVSQSHPRMGWVCWTLAFGVWGSVLSLKQHWVIDVVGGWALATAGAWVWRREMRG